MGCRGSKHVAVDPPHPPPNDQPPKATQPTPAAEEKEIAADKMHRLQDPVAQVNADAMMSQLRSSISKRASQEGHQPIVPMVKRTHTPGGTPLAGVMQGPQTGDRVCFRDKNAEVQRGEVFRRSQRTISRSERSGHSADPSRQPAAAAAPAPQGAWAKPIRTSAERAEHERGGG